LRRTLLCLQIEGKFLIKELGINNRFEFKK
jgi:hypothetical protein